MQLKIEPRAATRTKKDRYSLLFLDVAASELKARLTERESERTKREREKERERERTCNERTLRSTFSPLRFKKIGLLSMSVHASTTFVHGRREKVELLFTRENLNQDLKSGLNVGGLFAEMSMIDFQTYVE